VVGAEGLVTVNSPNSNFLNNKGARPAQKKGASGAAVATNIYDQVPLSAGEVVRDFVGNKTLRGLVYGSFIPLTEAYLVLPALSAECERGVSVLKLIKTARRNCLSQAALEQLMMIKLNGLSAEGGCWEGLVLAE
jgi:hypothetical protein